MNAGFQRIARRDKKAFLSEQCKEVEENNTMRKTRDLFKTIRDTKGTFHEKMDKMKNRNSMEIKEAEVHEGDTEKHINGCLREILQTRYRKT